jgi:hypothetical protein
VYRLRPYNLELRGEPPRLPLRIDYLTPERHLDAALGTDDPLVDNQPGTVDFEKNILDDEQSDHNSRAETTKTLPPDIMGRMWKQKSIKEPDEAYLIHREYHNRARCYTGTAQDGLKPLTWRTLPTA